MKINQAKKLKQKDVKNEAHLNHMAGHSYDILDPVKQLRVIASSSFFGEPNYYHSDVSDERHEFRSEHFDSHLEKQAYLEARLGKVISYPDYHGIGTAKLMEMAVDDALNFNPEETLREAARLRMDENIRTTPQVIMVRAAHHENVRGSGLISKYASQIIGRADEPAVQLAYHNAAYHGKAIPNALKKAWKSYLEGCSEFQLAKYRMESREVKTVDVVNMVHAKGEAINKLMRNELKLSVDDTWEALISKEGSTKETWERAVLRMGHMALLRNLRNLIKNGVSENLYLPKLIETAKDGKQLPFRYYSAYMNIVDDLDGRGSKGQPSQEDRFRVAIETCMMNSIRTLPEFSGRVVSLCDNSGSAQRATTSSMGSMAINDIANLTGVLTAKCALDQGYVGIFGDGLEMVKIGKQSSVFDDLKTLKKKAGTIGGGTENGIWLFFDKAIKNKEHWDHIFIYSDMQAGHGGLYGIDQDEYKDFCFEANSSWHHERYIDVAKLVKAYRENVNRDVYVYMVQVAGYKDTLTPEFYDRTYILGGWGEGLLKFAHAMSQERRPMKMENKNRMPAEAARAVVKVRPRSGPKNKF